MLKRACVAAVVAAVLCICAAGGLADSIDVRLDGGGAVFVCSRASGASGAQTRRAVERIAIPGFGSSAASGSPALPCKLVYVALPPNADIATLRIDPGALPISVIPGDYDILPVPPTAPAHPGLAPALPAPRSADIYGRDEFYPREHLRLREVGRMRSWNVAVLEYWPYCYNPASGRLRAATTASAALHFCTRAADEAPGGSAPVGMANLLANRDQALEWYAEAGGDAVIKAPGYAIITTSAIASASAALSEFVELQMMKGFSVSVVTDGVWGGGTGDEAAENIRAWLRGNYIPLELHYVLLIGGPDPAFGDVPMKMLWPRRNQSSYRDAPSDFYYADLSGNWDLDGDGFFGEEPDDFGAGGIDRLPELHVGRIPFYGSITDLDRILRKTIDYQSAVPGDWSRRLLLPMKPLDKSTPCYHLGEGIRRDVALPLGLDPVRVYEGDYGLQPLPEYIPCESFTVREAWEPGAGFVVWMSHGGSNYASGVLSSSQCADLNDARPAIVYQGSCLNGRPEDSGNLGYSLLRHGAVSTLSASRVSWYYLGETDFTGTDSIGGLGYQYAMHLLRHSQTCGAAAAVSRLSVPLSIWPNHLVFNTYGDPSIRFGCAAPGGLMGKVLDTSGSPVPGARVLLIGEGRSVYVEDDGSFVLPNLHRETCEVSVSAPGFYSQRFYDLPIAPGRATRMEVRLVGAPCGSISGQVSDAAGGSVAEAVVEVEGIGRSAASQQDGTYALHDLPPGQYILRVTRPPYARTLVMDCTVNQGACTKVDVVMHLCAGNPPPAPSVRATGRFQSDAGPIVAEWSCPEGQIAGYEYAVSRTWDEQDILPGGGWVWVGASTSAARSNLGLQNGDLVRVLVRARSTSGEWSEIGFSEPIRAVHDCPDIPSAKVLSDGTWVRIGGLLATRMGPGPECFVQQPQRTAAVLATGDWSRIPWLTPGTRAAAVGRLDTTSPTTALLDAELMPSIPLAPIRPLGMSNPSALMPSNAGLLVTVWGKVTGASAHAFTIRDGSRSAGIAVQCIGIPAPAPGDYIRATGIATPEGVVVLRGDDVESLAAR